MPAGVYNFTIEQGATFRRPFTLKDSEGNPLDLTNFTARMHIRPEVDAEEVMVYLTTENGRLSTNASGVVEVFMHASVTATVDRDGVYDMELISGTTGDVNRVLKGKVRLDPEVTR